MNTAYFAGGCFWCISPEFRNIKGVTSVLSGYAGGDEVNPTYEDVKKQKTGHRETIAVSYDPSFIEYKELVEFFLSHVDPFDQGGQYIDRGFSYTLALYPSDEHEMNICRSAVNNLEQRSGKAVFISVEPMKIFYMAEEYHQDYDLKNPDAFRKELIESGRLIELN